MENIYFSLLAFSLNTKFTERKTTKTNTQTRNPVVLLKNDFQETKSWECPKTVPLLLLLA